MRPALLLALLTAPIVASAQAPADSSAATARPIHSMLLDGRPYEPRRVWVSLGAGVATRGVGGQLFVGVRLDERHFLMPRIAAEGEVDLTFFGTLDRPLESATEAGLLYAWVEETRGHTLVVAVGLAAVNVVRRGERLRDDCAFSPIPCGAQHERLSTWTVGVPVSVQAYGTPHRNFGLGMHLFANLNPKASFGGLTLGWMIGGR